MTFKYGVDQLTLTALMLLQPVRYRQSFAKKQLIK